jgi:hypothetical protein
VCQQEFLNLAVTVSSSDFVDDEHGSIFAESRKGRPKGNIGNHFDSRLVSVEFVEGNSSKKVDNRNTQNTI